MSNWKARLSSLAAGIAAAASFYLTPAPYALAGDGKIKEGDTALRSRRDGWQRSPPCC